MFGKKKSHATRNTRKMRPYQTKRYMNRKHQMAGEQARTEKPTNPETNLRVRRKKTRQEDR
jgi:hypothetical protein